MLKRRSRPGPLDIVGGLLGLGLLQAAMVPVAAQRPAATGRIEGRVTFQGPLPPPSTVGETGDPQPRLYVDQSGGLHYAVVFLPDARPARAAVPSTPAVVNQRNYIFEPQVLAVRAGRSVRFTSDDVANHNVRARGPTAANTFFLSTGPGSIGSARHAFAATPGNQAILLTCDVHSWMSAWMYAFDHDAFAMTEADGRFVIDNIPAGRYRLSVRQPAGPLARDLGVDVSAGTTARVDVRFTHHDIGVPSR